MHAIAKQLTLLEDELNEFFLERPDVIRSAILALIGGKNWYCLGTPGSGKTMIVKAIIRAIINARRFEIAMSKRRTAEKFFGPMDLKALRDGNQWHVREHYASAVELLLIDEIGKMSDILGHDILALLNEKEYHEVRDGQSVHDAPISSAFTCSNEEITSQSDDAAALWDRLPWRVITQDIKDRGNFARFLSNRDKPTFQTTIEWSELKDVIDNVVPAIKIPESVVQAMVTLRYDRFQADGLAISTRRWGHAMEALQAAAFLAGRDEVAVEDIACLQWVLWDNSTQYDKVARLTLSAASPFADRLFEYRDILDAVNVELSARELLDVADFNRTEYGRDATQKLDSVRTSLDTLLIEAEGRPIPMFKAVSDMHRDTLIRMYTGILDMPREVVETTMIQSLLGSGAGGNR